MLVHPAGDVLEPLRYFMSYVHCYGNRISVWDKYFDSY